jgi:hypothetical protein
MRTSTRRARIIAAGVLGAIVVVLAVVLLSGGEDETPYADRGTPGDSGATPRGRPVRPFGQTVRLKTYLTTVEVRPVSFVTLAAGESSGAGVGVDLAIRNVGRAPYRDQPAQAASVRLRGGGEAERVYLPAPRCGGPPEDTISIPPGETLRFCLPFEATARPELFVYAPESGLPGSRGAPEAAAWDFSR